MNHSLASATTTSIYFSGKKYFDLIHFFFIGNNSDSVRWAQRGNKHLFSRIFALLLRK